MTNAKATGDASSLELTLTPSTAAAGTNITAEAKLSDGTYLLPAYTIELSVDGGTATFQNADQGSDGSTFTFPTNPLGRVDATLVAPSGTSGQVKATVTKDPGGGSQNLPSPKEQPYTFTGQVEPTRTLTLYPSIDGASGYTSSWNTVLAAIMIDGGYEDASYTGSVVFTITKGNATFVNSGGRQQITIPLTNGFAEASFVLGEEGPEIETVTATLLDNSLPPSEPLDFTFLSSSTPMDKTLKWQQDTYGGAAMVPLYQFNGSENQNPPNLYFCLPATDSSRFEITFPFFDNHLNSKVTMIPNAQISSDWVAIPAAARASPFVTGVLLNGNARGAVRPATTTLNIAYQNT